MGLCMYVWFSQLGFPHNTLAFPYNRQSPLTKRSREYKDIYEVEEEVIALSETFADSKFTLGRNLYFHVPLFADPIWFVNEEYVRLMKEYNYMKNYNIPMAKSLDDADSYKLDMFDLINSELNAIQQYIGEKNG